MRVLPLSLLLLGACSEFDNLAACRDFTNNLVCGDLDTSLAIDCLTYEPVVACDLTPYFECLADNAVCNEDVDPAELDTQLWGSCDNLLECS